MDKRYDAFGLFDQLFSDFGLTNDFWNSWNTVYQVPNFPPVNVFINKDTKEMIFEFALAGYKKENISINFSGDYMELKLRESEEKANQQLEIVRRGIKNCNINFKYYCPADKYSRENVQATFVDGILKVVIDPVKKVETKMITIN